MQVILNLLWKNWKFYNRSIIQITDLTISLFNILVSFTKNVLVSFILIVNMIFLTLLDEFSSSNIIYFWNFMTYLFYFRLLTSFLANFFGKFDLLMFYVEILNQNQILDLILVKASQSATGISVA